LRFSLLAVVALCSAFYFWTADGAPAGFSSPYGYYNRLTEALLHGQTSLLVKPSPRLLALRDPYDPVANNNFRYHDAILYRGKYYLYWGLAPVMLAYLPFRAFSGQYLNDATACATFASLGLLFFALLVAAIRNDRFPKASPWIAVSLVLLGAFASMIPFVLRRPLVYEAAVTCGYFLTAVFYYTAYHGAFRNTLKLGWLAAAGVALGLCFLCRPDLTICALVLATACLMYARAGKRFWAALALSFGPLLACIVIQAFYNYARFGSPTEFGLRYQLAGIYMPDYVFFSIPRGLCSALFYLFSIPIVSPVFPFVTASSNGLVGPLYTAEMALAPSIPNFGFEQVIGVPVATPLLLLLVLVPFLGSRAFGRKLHVFVLSLLAATLILVAFMCVGFSATMRYEVDFLPMLLVVLSIVVLWIAQREKPRWAKRALGAAFAILVFYSACISTAMSFTGYQDWYRQNYRSQFDGIIEALRPFERTLADANAYGAVRARVIVPACRPKALGDPLMTSGVKSSGDFLSLRCLRNDGTFAVTWDHWGIPPRTGVPLHLQSGQAITVDIVAPPLFPATQTVTDFLYPAGTWKQITKTCLVRINGEIVFRDDECATYPAGPRSVFLFRNLIGGTTTAPSFAGRVLSLERVPPR
jgi:hypothetical protein